MTGARWWLVLVGAVVLAGHSRRLPAQQIETRRMAGADSAPAVMTAPLPYAYCGRPRSKTVARVAAATAFVGTNVLLWDFLKKQWWSGVPAEKFRFNYDWAEPWHDQDKFGHLLGGYQLTRAATEVLEASCISRKTAAVWAWAYSNAFQFQIEMFDATQQEYGFSPPDILFNTMGSTMRLSQEFFPVMRHIKPTFSYWPSSAMSRKLDGTVPNASLHPTIDYSGQTYWVSFDVDSLAPRPVADWWPGFLRVSVGAGIGDWVRPGTTSPEFTNRRWLVSLDLDLGKLPGNGPTWNAIKRNLSFIHIMGPAIQVWPRADAYLLYK